MHILAINCGSSSIKSALIDSDARSRRRSVRVEGIGSESCTLFVDGKARPLSSATDLAAAIDALLMEWRNHDDFSSIDALVHRVVHGGERFARPVQIDTDVLRQLDAIAELAPLHNPPALSAVRVAQAMYPGLPHIAVFDTAFHSTLPRRAREYALPADVRAAFGIRRFGFHGLSHSHVMHRVAHALKRPAQDLRIVSCHLGSGASVAAIEYGRSVETSMGMTPLEGLVMGTRAGDLDPGVLLRLLHTGGMSAADLDSLLNHRSGLKGLAGTSDMRDIERRAADGDDECRLALLLYAHRIRKYIGAYAAVMGGVDAIAFTGGVGENSAGVRHRCMQRLEFLGAALDEDSNRTAKFTATLDCVDIASADSRVALFVIRADEEATMVRDAARYLGAPLFEAAAPRAVRPQAPQAPMRIPVAVSARHAHLSQATLEKLFGPNFKLDVRADLSQLGQFASQETVTLAGPRGRIYSVRLMGPPRERDQVEISRSDEFVLGVDAPVRISGDLTNTPGIVVEGPAGRVTLASGLICARRHIHMSTQVAASLGVKDHDTVDVRIDSEGRDLTFGDVTVRVAPDFRLELHLDTDEANAAGVKSGDHAELIVPSRER